MTKRFIFGYPTVCECLVTIYDDDTADRPVRLADARAEMLERSAALAVDCPHCGSSAGFPCRSATGSITTARLTAPHASRKAAAR